MTTLVDVDPQNIQSELTRIWDSLEQAQKLRACLFNLIVYTQNNARKEYIHTLVQKVIEKFPSRVLFVTIDRMSGESLLKTSVSVLTPPPPAQDFACDYIQIDASRDEEKRVPYIILPHLLADLPVYLLWADDLTDEKNIARELEKLVTRIIFDSEATDNLPRFLSQIKAHMIKVDVADLNWARTEGFRHLLSSTFYTPEKLSLLQRAKTITIRYGSHPTNFFCHTKIQAIYLQAWLGASLGLTLEKIEGQTFFYPSMQIVLAGETSANLPPGMIYSVHIATNEGEEYHFLRNLERTSQITIHFSTKERCELPTKWIFARSEGGSSLVKEITHKGTSHAFLAALTQLTSTQDSLPC